MPIKNESNPVWKRGGILLRPILATDECRKGRTDVMATKAASSYQTGSYPQITPITQIELNSGSDCS
ncbi:MAG: hypothetical protein AABN95_04880 [Acidobacteriota bacterium]